MQETQPPKYQQSLTRAQQAVPACCGCRRSQGCAGDLLALLAQGNLGTGAVRGCHGFVFRLARPRSWILSTLAEKFSIFCAAF